MRTLKFVAAAAACLILTGCVDENTARRALVDAGYEDITITGWSPFSCAESDAFATGFTATNPRGRRVSGTVCSGWMKGATIRF